MIRRASLAGVVTLGLFGGGCLAVDRWVESTELPPLGLETSTLINDRSGALLRAYTVADGRWRLPLRVGDVDPQYLAFLIAYEDQRFYRHHGVDLLAFVRATGQALWNRRIISGGSTLTMQVARLLEGGGTGRWRPKMRQIRVALALERRLAKADILDLYLKLAPFGGNLEGVRAASLSYFGKPPSRLTTAQSALLVALPQSPERRRPDRAPLAAKSGRDRVLARLVFANVISANEADAARTEPIHFGRYAFPAIAAHLADRVRATLPFSSSLRLTIDRSLQVSLEKLVGQVAEGQASNLSAAIVVMDHQNGEVLASVGSAGFFDPARQGFVDMTMAIRSPGSTLKPVIYGLAFELGLAHPETLIQDRPTAFGTYTPQNFDKQFYGTLPVRRALQLSLNIPAVALLEGVGPNQLLARMRRAGVTAHLPGDGPPGLAVALGGVGLRLIDLVGLYGAIASGGHPVPMHHLLREPSVQTGGLVAHSPRTARVTPDDMPVPGRLTGHPSARMSAAVSVAVSAAASGGESAPVSGRDSDGRADGSANSGVDSTEFSAGPVMSPSAAWHVANILTGMRGPLTAPRNHLAYKTGTSYGYRDAWAIGFDGRHVIGVWLGRADGASVPGLLGADLAAPLLFAAFGRLKPKLVPLPPPPPSALLVQNADLPQPLRKYRGLNTVQDLEVNPPEIAFPPDGARIDLQLSGKDGLPLVLKVRNGTPPFTWIADGVPFQIASRSRQATLVPTGPGYLDIAVIDATGQSQHARVELQ